MKTYEDHWKEMQETSLVVEEYEGGWTYGDTPENVSVKREISGKLAHDIRARFGVDDDTPVFITEEEIEGYYSEMTSYTDYVMIIECGKHEKRFGEIYASKNFEQLLKWLDETEEANAKRAAENEASHKKYIAELHALAGSRRTAK